MVAYNVVEVPAFAANPSDFLKLSPMTAESVPYTYIYPARV